MAKISYDTLDYFMHGRPKSTNDNISKRPLGDLYLSTIENVKDDPEDFMRVVNEVLSKL